MATSFGPRSSLISFSSLIDRSRLFEITHFDTEPILLTFIAAHFDFDCHAWAWFMATFLVSRTSYHFPSDVIAIASSPVRSYI